MYSVCCASQMHGIHNTKILKAYLWHVSLQVCHLQGEQSKNFKKQSCLVNNSFPLTIWLFFNWHFVLAEDGALVSKYVGETPLAFVYN
jgi:hypothetical protein